MVLAVRVITIIVENEAMAMKIRAMEEGVEEEEEEEEKTVLQRRRRDES